MKRYVFLITLAVIALDQLVKYLVRSYIPLNSSFMILPFLRLTHIENTGAGFSMLQGQNTVLIFVMIAVIGALLYWFHSFTKAEQPFIACIIGGAAGNLIDRVFLGHVIDFVDLRIWPVFNAADAAISIGIIALLYLSIKR